MKNDLNKIKAEKLKMSSFGKASAILRKTIIFQLAKKCGLDNCYRCKEKITDISDFTIDHKEEWLYSENPIKLFFSFDNIAFSHFSCNCNPPGKQRQLRIIKSSTGFKGVKYRSKNKKKPFEVNVSKDGKAIFIGNFASINEAVKIYDEAVVKYWGKKAITNKSLGLI